MRVPIKRKKKIHGSLIFLKPTVLSTKVYQRKQQTVVRNVLPVLWHLLGSLTGSGAVPRNAEPTGRRQYTGD